MTATYRKSNGHFTFHNQNPKGLLTSCDCTIRAISYALNETWEETFTNLFKVGLEIKDVTDSKRTFEKYLNDTGYSTEKQPRKANGKKYTIQEFAKLNPKMRAVINTAGHLTCIDGGKIIDTWDCGEYSVGNYWIIKNIK